MKVLLTLLIFFTFSISSFANDDAKLHALVTEWNQLHNSFDVSAFSKLYADHLFFYGRKKDKQECIAQKEKFMKLSYSQQIIGPVVIHYHENGIAKTDFTKKVVYKNRSNQYFSYLLFKKINNDWMIVGESDTQTDEWIGSSPGLGKKVSGTNYTLNFIIGIISIGGSLILFKRHRKRKEEEKPNILEQDISELLASFKTINNFQDPLLSNTGTKTYGTDNIPSSEQKGKDFEKYVVERFNKTFFTLKEWRGDKFHNGIYPISSTLPDLEYHFLSNNDSIFFAVECKWRTAIYNNELEWANDRQLDTYKQFESANNTPVFVIIGIGGKPSNPNEIYCIPLRDINSNTIKSTSLKQYKRYAKGDFALNTSLMILE